MGSRESDIANWLDDLLTLYAHPLRLGRSHVEVIFLIDQERDLKRRPDVAFIANERWPIGRRAPRQDAWDIVPDLMVEVVSPSNSASEVMQKVRDYFHAGARLVWVIYPIEEMVQVFETATTSRVLRRDDTLDGGPVLPGFTLPLASLFEDEPEATTPA